MGPCETCILAKSHRTRIPRISLSTTTRPLELLHNDVCGPMPVPSRTRNHYILTITDDYSRFTWVYHVPNKSDVFSKFRFFKSAIERKLNLPIACLRSDRGGSTCPTLSTYSSTKMGSNGSSPLLAHLIKMVSPRERTGLYWNAHEAWPLMQPFRLFFGMNWCLQQITFLIGVALVR